MTVRGSEEFVRDWNAALANWDASLGTNRIWERDAGVWTGGDEASWLGWLAAADTPEEELGALAATLESTVPGGCDSVLLLGMGGSSLAAEVIDAIAVAGRGSRRIRILDSTEPTMVQTVLDATDWSRTVVVVASKSGTTLEPNVLFDVAYAAAQAALGAERAPAHVIAITDPDSALDARMRTLGSAAVIHGDASIGGRFSALSPFGLVPAALQGVPLNPFLGSARAMAKRCRDAGANNPGVALGAFLASAAARGRNKCTLLLPPALAPLGVWIEQLVAESTGKRGVAVIPVEGEAPAPPDRYGTDRAFVHVRARDDQHDGLADALADVGHPVFRIDDAAAGALAAEFFRWEFATAVAGSMLGVNPFDQPDVEAAKVAARARTDAYERGGEVQSDAAPATDLRSALSALTAPSYVAILAYLPMFDEVAATLQQTRLAIRDARGVATLLGFGPRYLHSTGQAFKGGPPQGVFIQLTCDAPSDVPIPGRRLTLGAVIGAQAAGDREVLRARGRPVVHVHLAGELAPALESFNRDVAAALV